MIETCVSVHRQASPRHIPIVVTLAAMALAASQPHSAFAWSTASTPTASETAACSELEKSDFSQTQDAPFQITSAKMVEASGIAGSFCKVEAYVYPQVGIEIHLPLAKDWNGKLMTTGNGGWAGSIYSTACDPHLKRGYACVATDTGHRGGDGMWAVNNLPPQVDFGYRAIHVSTLAAKAVVTRYYSKAAQRAYFMGCSTGGYQGLVAAQRFPWDFDGIIAGAPDMDEADLTMREIWAQRANLDAAGKPILDAPTRELLHRAALEKCDMDDGVKDGIIGNPVGCSSDPAKLLCNAGQSQQCLTAAQVEAAKRIYAGPPHIEEKAVRGALAGSELNWDFGTDTGYADSLFKEMIYGANPGWTSSNYDFDRDYKRLGLAALYTDTNPDLRPFKAAGGKLLVYQGGTDTVEMPTAIVDYYETVEKVMGGSKPTQDFFRLFVIPGMNHCGDGVGAYSIDYLTYLENWVERDQAPDEMIGARISDAYLLSLPLPEGLPADASRERRIAAATRTLQFPLDPKIPLSFARPMYPYPKFARYSSGDPNQAASFHPAQP
jgi:pimeloyl-ACP methyl ester carboxylesterase